MNFGLLIFGGVVWVCSVIFAVGLSEPSHFQSMMWAGWIVFIIGLFTGEDDLK